MVLQRINTFFSKIETVLLCLIIALMIGLAILEIVLRYGPVIIFRVAYFFSIVDNEIVSRYGVGKSLLWKTVMLQNLTLWLCFLGAALATAEKRHISIDVLNRILPEKIKHYCHYLIDILSIIVVSILVYYGFVFLINEQKMQATLIGTIPLWWAKTIIPFGFVMIDIHLLLQLGIRLTGNDTVTADTEGDVD